MADIQIEHYQDKSAARVALQRIIERGPNRAPAAQAESRISRLNLELKGKEKNRAIKLGSYEKRLGGPTTGSQGRGPAQ